jgi:hypothetical protein
VSADGCNECERTKCALRDPEHAVLNLACCRKELLLGIGRDVSQPARCAMSSGGFSPLL